MPSSTTPNLLKPKPRLNGSMKTTPQSTKISKLDHNILTSFTLTTWTSDDYENLLNLLIKLSDIEYAKFTTKGTRTRYPILGVRLPLLRQLAKAIHKGNYVEFLNVCDGYINNQLNRNVAFEIVMLRGFVVASLRDFDELMDYFWSQVELIDDWSLCDSFCNSLKLATRLPEQFLPVIDNLIQTNAEFKVRVGLVMLLTHFVREPYLDTIFRYLDQIQSDAYYINMAEAWLLCEVFIKFPDAGLDYLRRHHLNNFTLRRTISKIRDSYCVSNEMKDYLRATFLP